MNKFHFDALAVAIFIKINDINIFITKDENFNISVKIGLFFHFNIILKIALLLANGYFSVFLLLLNVVLHRCWKLISNYMSFIYHSCNKLRTRFNMRKGNKKSGRHFFLFKRIENFFCTSVFITTIKCKINNLLTACIKANTTIFFI